MDPTSVILALRILTQVGITIEQIGKIQALGENASPEEVRRILEENRNKILENATN